MLFEGIQTTRDILIDDENIAIMLRDHASNQPEFKREYHAGFEKYIAGRWEEAILVFRK